jgi:hypothetical protein
VEELRREMRRMREASWWCGRLGEGGSLAVDVSRVVVRAAERRDDDDGEGKEEKEERRRGGEDSHER